MASEWGAVKNWGNKEYLLQKIGTTSVMLNTIMGYRSNDLDLYSNSAYNTPKTMSHAIEAMANNSKTRDLT
jgi:hypothetical protein